MSEKISVRLTEFPGIHGTLDRERKPLHLLLEDGQKLVLHDVTVGPGSRSRGDYMHIHGWGYLPNDRNETFLMGNFSTALKKGELWVGRTEELELLFSLYDRDMDAQLLQRAVQAARKSRRGRREILVKLDDALEFAESIGASSVLARRAMRALFNYGSTRKVLPYKKFPKRGAVDLVSVVEFINSPDFVHIPGIGPGGLLFIRRWHQALAA